jgi:hypothetical protein
MLYAQFVPSKEPTQQSSLRRETFFSPINDLKLAMVDRHLIITKTPTDGIEFVKRPSVSGTFSAATHDPAESESPGILEL